MKKKRTAETAHTHITTTPTLNAKGESTPLLRAYDRWIALLKDETATDAAIAAAKAAFLAAPLDLPTTDNLAFPLVEALERQDCLLAPQDPWYPEIVVDGVLQPLHRVVDIDDLTYLRLLEWSYGRFPHVQELIYDALERSAAALGYLWSEPDGRFVVRTEYDTAA